MNLLGSLRKKKYAKAVSEEIVVEYLEKHSVSIMKKSMHEGSLKRSQNTLLNSY